MGRIEALKAMLGEGRVGFMIDEVMDGSHHFVVDHDRAGEQPFVFKVTWGTRHLGKFVNPMDPEFLTSFLFGTVTIGGGVPRNWAQQIGPLADIINMRIGSDLRVPRIRYGVRICPEPVHWGGLSGCSYSEGVSWGKFLPPEEGGRFAEVHCDATIAWPLLIRAVLEARGELPAGQ